MNDYFLQLFEYDTWCNQLMANAVNEAGNPPAALRLMAHLLAAKNLWLNRCRGTQQPNETAWPEVTDLSSLLIEETNNQWAEFLAGADLTAEVSYRNLSGVVFTNRLIDVVAHVANHGTHHRAQVGQHLKLAGTATLPQTDYIYWIRNVKQL